VQALVKRQPLLLGSFTMISKKKSLSVESQPNLKLLNDQGGKHVPASGHSKPR